MPQWAKHFKQPASIIRRNRRTSSALDPSEKLEKKLDEALLNAQLDITYAHEMNVQITDTINMMKKVYKSTKSKKMREWLVKTAGDLENIQKQINQIIKAD